MLASELNLPTEEELLADFNALARADDALARCFAALETRVFTHPDGRTDDLGVVYLMPGIAALLSFLAKQCSTFLSIEVGFGMGSSATTILGSRNVSGRPFQHLVFDPYGLPDGRGSVVLSYLETRFGDKFRRLKKRSEHGLAELAATQGTGIAGLIFIDGGHTFENAFVDFVLADQLCSEGGYIVFDDAWFPAIETVINYVKDNRPDYAVAHLPVQNASVLRKIGKDTRDWCAFKPFAVPQREDWTRA